MEVNMELDNITDYKKFSEWLLEIIQLSQLTLFNVIHIQDHRPRGEEVVDRMVDAGRKHVIYLAKLLRELGLEVRTDDQGKDCVGGEEIMMEWQAQLAELEVYEEKLRKEGMN
jgi:hypothetical protein